MLSAPLVLLIMGSLGYLSLFFIDISSKLGGVLFIAAWAFGFAGLIGAWVGTVVAGS